MPRQRIAFQLLHNQTVKPIEAAAQIYWRGGHQHPRSTSDVQHGSARSSSGNICTSEPVCSRTIQPCGLTTSTGQRDAGLGSRTSWNFTFGGTAARSKRNHRLRLDSPMLCWAANSFCVNRLWWNFASNRCRRLDVQCRRLFPLFCVSIPPWSHSLSPETRRGPSAAYIATAHYERTFDRQSTVTDRRYSAMIEPPHAGCHGEGASYATGEERRARMRAA